MLAPYCGTYVCRPPWANPQEGETIRALLVSGNDNLIKGAQQRLKELGKRSSDPPPSIESVDSVEPVVEGVESDDEVKRDTDGTVGGGIITDVSFDSVYELGAKVGEGAYSTVFSCTHRYECSGVNQLWGGGYNR